MAVVASASADDRRELQRLLEQGGYATKGAAPGASLVDEVVAAAPDILLVDLPTALAHAESLADVVVEHPGLAALPVILVLPEGGAPGLPESLTRYASDVVFHPVQPMELLHRTEAAISRRRRHQAQKASSARLRASMRRISARIRATNDPAVMVDLFLSGIGSALGATSTVLQVFEDERVAARSSGWTDSRAASPDVRRDPVRVPLPQPAHQDESLALALTLWEDTATAAFSTDGDTAGDAGTVPAPAWLGEDRGPDRALHGIVAALGEGDSPFGLLWIISEQTPVRWSGVEAALTQHVLGNLAHGLIQAQLISRQQQAVRKLRALNQAKSDFVGTVNHELRTPLASIAGYLEMINDGVGGELPPEASTMLQAVERNTAKLSRLIDNISALSAQDTDAGEHGPVDLSHLVSELAGLAAPQARSGGITVASTVPDRPVTVAGDREQLTAAFTILLSNAIKFTQEDGEVSVEVTDAPDSVVVVVRDTGIGIPAEDLPLLFDSFHRASNAGSVLPGARVGLSLAKRTVESHGGSITVESSLGVGTEVAVTLPLLNSAAVG